VPGFIAGAAAGGLAIAAGLLSGTRLIALAAIPATAWAAFEGLRWVSRAEAAEEHGRESRALAERERKARETWERDTADVRGVMRELGAPSLAALDDLAGRAREARAVLARAEAEMQSWRDETETQDAEAERVEIQQEIGVLETQITSGTGGFVRDVQSVEQEIGRLEMEMETGPFLPLEEATIGGPVLEERPRGEPLRALVERASAELGLTTGAALRAAQTRVQQLLPALSGQRFSSFLVDERGNLQVQASGRLVPLTSLGPPEQDVCYAVLKVAFLEQGLAAGKTVALIDDAFGTLPEGSRRILARLLKQIAQGRQVVHGTSDVIFREAADHAA
jgi:hypothetical protein